MTTIIEAASSSRTAHHHAHQSCDGSTSDVVQPGIASLVEALPQALLDSIAVVPTSRARRAADDNQAGVERPALAVLRERFRSMLTQAYPDIRVEAKRAIEAEIKRRYRVSLNADRTYYNTFAKGTRSSRAYTGWMHHGHPVSSRSLTDMMLQQFVHAGDNPNEKAGLYREGSWATVFAECNDVPLRPADLADAIKKSNFFANYRRQLDLFWTRNLDAMQLLGEVDTILFAESHRRDGARARALGLPDALAGSLRLSDGALAMLAAAVGRPDPDFGTLGVQLYAFDINGYPAEDMAWLRADNGHVVLVMPGNAHHLRQYSSLDAMRADIRAMVQSAAGRRELMRHFSDYNRRDGTFRQGVDKWLLDIKGGGYDNRIAYAEAPFTGNFAAITGIRTPQGHAEALLSDKALDMISEAAGNPDPSLLARGTESFIFDIDSYPSSDMTWLRARDGHVVLIIPGSERPVREYRNADAMRADIHAMTNTAPGRAALASHFTLYNLRDGRTYQGVEKWLRDIRDGGYDDRIAYAPAAIKGNIFRNQFERTRDAQLARVDDIRQGRADSDAQRQRWVQSFGAFNPLRVSLIDGGRATTATGADMTRTKRRGWRDMFYDGVARERLRHWHAAVRLRMENVMERLSGWITVTGHASVPPTPPPAPPPSPQESPFNTPPGSPDASRCAMVVGGRRANSRGFLERTDFNVLYRIERVGAAPRAELAGLQADQDGFIVSATLDGPMVGTFLTREAALQWWWSENANVPFRLYEIDARGLHGVSFGDNRANNGRYQRLVEAMVDALASNRQGIHWFYISQQLRSIEEQLVHLSLEGLSGARIQSVPGVGDQRALRAEHANPLQMDDIGPWLYDGDDDLWVLDSASSREV